MRTVPPGEAVVVPRLWYRATAPPQPVARSPLRQRLTIAQLMGFGFAALIAALVGLFVVVSRGTQASLLESSERIRDQASREIANRVALYLGEAPEAIRRFERQITLGLVQPREPTSLEPALAALLAGSQNLSEVTLTTARLRGFEANDDPQLEPGSGAQVSFVRSIADEANPAGQFWRKRTYREGGQFVADELEVRGDAAQATAPRRLDEPMPDPTEHLTFTSPARRQAQSDVLSTDLHFTQIDASLPKERQRVAVSFMHAISDATGQFLGVMRVGLLTEALDRAVQLRLAPGAMEDPHRIFLCDSAGRLLTRLSPRDRIGEIGDDLRVVPAALPGELEAALAVPQLRQLGPERPALSGALEHGGEDFLYSFRALPDTQDWVVGIVVPREHYLGQAQALRDRLLLWASLIIAGLILGGLWLQRGVRQAQGQIATETRQMNAFEFAPAVTDSAFRDVREVLESLERAKAAMRAMSKYVPVDLVRRLYREKSEPVLGGEQTEISLMFTDIRDFTNFAERLDPNVLADALGRYLGVMVRIIQQEHRGTIDKFIGDAVMALWNAPEEVERHPRLACLAALRCRAEAHALSNSPEWRARDLPPFETRFGLHCDHAMVGHFGAPDRLNYTAIGDAVNLAARLESLNKQYGTSILVSERIRDAVQGEFAFRRLDHVAVKGKQRPIVIFELLGLAGEPALEPEVVACYERAFDAYVAGEFAAAARMLDGQLHDPPSAVLRARCERYVEDPPPADWGGVYVSLSK
ncbi:MAG: hypothetical protein JSR82_02180 [Verrucomicrobia bacterium]|nr:hypothetical protein [Verrucomicrobiota bacterium]